MEAPGLGIIAEKNFRVYAHTAHELHARTLALFCDIEVVLPVLVVARITRRSVRRALACSLSAKHIVAYLSTHPHVDVALGPPENVVDAIYLWEAETVRVKATENVAMLSEFDSVEEFEEVAGVLAQAGIVLQRVEDTQIIVVSDRDRARDLVRDWRARVGNA